MNEEIVNAPEVPSIVRTEAVPPEDLSNFDSQGRIDVSPLVALANTPPEEAARYIAGAQKYNTTPQTYKSGQETFDKQTELEKYPSHTPVPVAREMNNIESASIVKKDLNKLNGADSFLSFTMEEIKGTGAVRKRNELLDKKLGGQTLTPDERVQLVNYNNEIIQHQKNMAAYHADSLESKVAGAADVVADFGRSIMSTADLVAMGMKAGAYVGLGSTILAPLAGPAILPAAAGFIGRGIVIGAGRGFYLGLARDAFVQTRANFYSQLMDENAQKDLFNRTEQSKKDADPNYQMKPTQNVIPEGQIKDLARGVGLISAALTAIPINIIPKNVPWLSSLLNPKIQVLSKTGEVIAGRGLSDMIQNSGMFNLVTALGRSGAAMGSAAALQETSQIIAKAMADSFSPDGKLIGSKDNFIAAMSNVVNNLPENAGKVATAGAKGFVEGAALSGGLNAIGGTVNAFAGRKGKSTAVGPMTEVPPEMRDVNPTSPNGPGGPIITPQYEKPFNTESGPTVPPVSEQPPIPPHPTNLSNASDISIEVRGTRAMQLADLIRQHTKMTKETETAKHLPDSIDRIRQSSWEDAGMPGVWVDRPELDKFVQDHSTFFEKTKNFVNKLRGRGVVNNDVPKNVSDEFSKNALNAIDKRGIMAGGVNAPIWIEMKNFQRMVDQNPDVADLAKEEPDDMSAARWKLHLSEKEKQRRGIVEAATPPSKPIELGGPRPPDSDILGEDGYLNQPTFTPAMEDVLPAAEIKKFNETQTKVRLKVAQAIQEDVSRQMDKLIDLQTQMNLVAEQEYQQGEIVSDRHIQITEDFLNNQKEVGELTPFQESQKKIGKPIFAIDPRSLNPVDSAKFATNKTLYDRGVFDPQGVNIIDAMVAFGVKTPSELLTILSETPTRQELTDKAIEFNKLAIEEETRNANLDFEKSKSIEALTDNTKVHLKELEILKNKYWSVTTKGFRRIALPLPKLPQIVIRAKNTVRETPIKSLNPNQWVVAERRSQRAAIDAIHKNEAELAFREKENAAFASQLIAETRIGIGKSNKMLKWIANLGSKKIQAQLKEAGPLYLNAINYFLDVYNFDPKQKGQSKIDAYNKYVDKMNENGQGDYKLPQEVLDWLTPKASAMELTLDQLITIHNTMKRIYHQAKLKNKLSRKFGVENDADLIAQEISEIVKSHSLYDPNKTVTNQNPGLIDKLKNVGRTGEAVIQNVKAVINTLDKGLPHQTFHRLIFEPIQGVGSYKGPFGLTARSRFGAAVRAVVKKNTKALGKEIDDLGVQKVFIPEYKDLVRLGNGHLTKLHLFRMQSLYGTSDNKAKLANFAPDMDPEVFLKIVLKVNERELSQKLFDYIQDTAWGTFKKFKSMVFEEHKSRTGEEPEFQPPESFEAFGKTYEGGHHRLLLMRDTDATFVESMHNTLEEVFNGNKKADVPFASAVEGYVRSPHTKGRVDHNYVPNLNVDAFAIGVEELIYAVTMSNPVRDVMTLLTNKSIANSIKSVVGQTQYRTLVNNVAALTKSVNAYNELQHGLLMRSLNTVLSRLSGAMIKNFIAYSPAIILKHTLLMTEMWRRMGITNGMKHTSIAMTHYFNPFFFKYWKEWNRYAATIDPSLADWTAGIDAGGSPIADVLPQRYIFDNKPWKVLADILHDVNKGGIHYFLGTQMAIIKSIGVQASIRQYLSGEAPGGPTMAELENMSDADKRRNAEAYAASIVADVTPNTDKSMLVKQPVLNKFAPVFSIVNLILNNIIGHGRQVGYDADAGIKEWKKGNYEGAYEKFDKGNRKTVAFIFLAILSKIVQNTAAGKNPFATGKDDEREDVSVEGATKFLYKTLSLDGSAGLPELMVGNVGETLPMGSSTIFSYEMDKGVSIPVLGAMSEMTKTANILTSVPDGMNYIDFIQTLGWNEWNHVMISGSIFVGGAPTKAIMSLMKNSDEGNGPPRIEVAGDVVLGAALSAMDKFNSKYSKDTSGHKETQDERLKRLLDKKAAQPNKGASVLPKETIQAVVQTNDAIKNQLAPTQSDANFDYQRYYDLVKFAESRGKWNARPLKKDEHGNQIYDRYGLPIYASSAFGYYQILKGTWENLMEKYPKAGLTERGRTSKDTRQQDIAMRLLTEEAVAALKKNGIPINDESLYYLHFAGVTPDSIKDAKAMYKDNTKKPVLLSSAVKDKDVERANPKIKKIRNTVQMKEFVVNALANGLDLAEKAGVLRAGENKFVPINQKSTEVISGRP